MAEPTGTNNRSNPYAQRRNAVRIARAQSSRTAFYPNPASSQQSTKATKKKPK